MYDSKTVFSDLTFMIATLPDLFQSHSASATSPIPEDTTIKCISAAAGDQTQVLATTTKSDTDTVTLVIPKSQVNMLSKKGAVDPIGIHSVP